MKTLEQIKSEVFALEIWTIHEDLDEVINEVAKRYAKEVALESLKNASDNLIEWSYEKYPDFKTAKDAISLESNIPEV